jgi:hypothetical protein
MLAVADPGGVPKVHVVGAATIAQRNVQVAVIRSEQHSAAVVVELRLVNLQDQPLRGGVGPVGVSRHAEL